jgi:hypothetical protein
LRRKLIIGGALAALLALGGVAYAASAINKYGATIKFSSSKPGSSAKPVPLTYTETLTASNVDSSKVAAPLVNIKTTIYGMTSNLKDFKTCPEKTIEKGPKYNAACPKGSEVAAGFVNSELGSSTLSKSAAVACNPDLAVYNGGGGKEFYFFTAPSPTSCHGLTTGATLPYTGTVSQSGKNLVINVPLPPDVSTKVANLSGEYGSLIKESIKVTALSTKVHGKTVYSQQSVACSGSKRPYSVAFTAVENTSSPKVTQTVKGSAKC